MTEDNTVDLRKGTTTEDNKLGTYLYRSDSLVLRGLTKPLPDFYTGFRPADLVLHRVQ